ncbi:hypothetical protein ABK046_51440, partial [Streptomyces caeruleatus]
MAFIHATPYNPVTNRKVGHIKLDADLYKNIVDRGVVFIVPRYLPMLIPPKKWDNKRRIGGYYRLK